ncbi:MAG: UPF0280 family protein [Spirochaetes bacterium]|nr:UPF0280 family protein [Spirochaetota bacterium]MBL7005684.1 UPF0280 family protein [Spirochaetia bacterium]
MYEPRTYRERMVGKGFGSFIACVEETDIWVGIDTASFSKLNLTELTETTESYIKSLRSVLTGYIAENTLFQTSLIPLEEDPEAAVIVQEMIKAAYLAGTGPMAAVAGAFSESIGNRLLELFPIREIIVENGGDIWISVKRPVRISVFAGDSPLSGKIGIIIQPEDTPMGVCTSSGTVGHSLSLGRADAVTIACKNTAEADALATAYGNRIHTREDIDRVIEEIKERENILSALLIYKDTAAVCGKCEVNIIHE